MSQTQSSSQRNQASGYWGRDLLRRETGSGVIQLHEANAPPEAVNPHGHSHAHIVFVTRGAYVTQVTGENGFINRPVAVLNPPGVWHRDHFVTGRGAFMTVDLTCAGLAEDFVKHAESAAVLQFCKRLAGSLEDKTQLELEDDLDSLAALYRFERPQDFAGVPSGIERAFEAIQESAEPWELTMSELAQIAGVHKNHLPRAFRKRFGVTPSQFACARQIELCASAIAANQESLADCAARFGFYDQAHMSARFRSHTGVSPSRWRTQIRTEG